jgi:uncharacterized oxidoreductase
MNITGNTVLITGGASGIGLALTGAFYREKNAVIVVGRNRQKLDEVKQQYPDIDTLQVDISNKQARLELAITLQSEFPALNMLVNNAGVAHFNNVQESPEFFNNASAEIETNYLAPLHLSLLLLPQLQRHQPAAVVNITSAGVYLPLTVMPGYSASKAALSTFTHVLRQQLADTNVRIFEVLPPAVDTELVTRFDVSKMQPDLLANKILSGIKKDLYEMPIGSARALKWLAKIAPGFFEGLFHQQMTKMLKKQ